MSRGGLSEVRLGRLHDVMAGYIERGQVPGLVTLVSRHGEVHADAIGVQSVGGQVPIRRDTIFRISSMTKPITAAATMILVEECKLRLDESVDRLLPELANRRVLKRLDGPLDDTVPARRPITVRDLLTFRMGFGIVFAPEPYPIQKAMDELLLGQGPPNPSVPPDPDEWIRRLGTLPLMYQPGERWMYNTPADILGVLVARASGQPFETLLRERLFEPLGMKDSAFSVPPEQLGRLPTSYWTSFATGALELFDAPDGQWSRPPAFPSGAAGLVSTADDYLAFAQMLLKWGAHDGERILSRLAVQVMTTDHLTPEQKAASGLVEGAFDGQGWGFGLAIVNRRDSTFAVPGSYGWGGGMGTLWTNDPHEDLVAILMTQASWTSASPPPVALDFLTLAYAAIDD